MKKLVLLGILALFAGAANPAKADVSFGFSFGGHRPHLPLPPIFVPRPPVVVFEHHDDCDRGHRGRECNHYRRPHWRSHSHGRSHSHWRSHSHRGHEHGYRSHCGDHGRHDARRGGRSHDHR